MLKTTLVNYSETSEEGYKHPSNFYIRNCFGDFIYFHSRDRAICQQCCDEIYGVGHYTVNASKMGKNSGTNTVRASLNSKSRAGSRPVK